MNKKRIFILICVLATVSAAAVGGWVAGNRIESPAEAAARTAAPPLLDDILQREVKFDFSGVFVVCCQLLTPDGFVAGRDDHFESLPRGHVVSKCDSAFQSVVGENGLGSSCSDHGQVTRWIGSSDTDREDRHASTGQDLGQLQR